MAVAPGVGSDMELERLLLIRSVPNALRRTGVLSSIVFPVGDEMYPTSAIPRVKMLTDTFWVGKVTVTIVRSYH